MAGYQTLIRKAVIQGTTPRLTFQIVTEDGIGFKPDTLTLSIYDYVCSCPIPPPGTIVNDRDDVDVLSSCDNSGNVVFYLEPEDTTLDTDAIACKPTTLPRRLLFTWTWGSPAKVGKAEIVLTLAPDRELSAR